MAPEFAGFEVPVVVVTGLLTVGVGRFRAGPVDVGLVAGLVVVDAGGLLDGRDVLPPIIPPPVTPPSCCATATPVHVHINRTANGRARRGRGVDINFLPVF